MSPRSNSWSSDSSAPSSFSPVRSGYSSYDLESRATEILKSLANNTSNAEQISRHISPHIKVEHGEEDPVYSVEKYLLKFSDASARCPNLHLDIKEACVDESQRKVWIWSEITGLPGGTVKERVDMLTFDEQGVLVGSIDHQRVRRRYSMGLQVMAREN